MLKVFFLHPLPFGNFWLRARVRGDWRKNALKVVVWTDVNIALRSWLAMAPGEEPEPPPI